MFELALQLIYFIKKGLNNIDIFITFTSTKLLPFMALQNKSRAVNAGVLCNAYLIKYS